MTEEQAKKETILVVQDEDIFSEFLMNFQANRYTVLFAVEPAEALTLCEERSPGLVVLPVTEAEGAMGEVCALAREDGALLLGLLDEAGDGGSDRALNVDVDRVVSAKDEEAVTAAARELLKERRARPRVQVSFRVKVGDAGRGTVRDVSATAMRVQLKTAVSVGDRLPVEIGWGDAPVAFDAEVGRVRSVGAGYLEAVLNVPESAAGVREYLDNLVRRILEVDHYLSGGRQGPTGLRGPAAWKLARRAEAIIRESRELQALNPEVVDAAEASVSGVRARYELGEKLARWGVGDVYDATVRLVGGRVSVKRLCPEFIGDPLARAKIEQEARVASVLHSTAVLDIVDFGEDGDEGVYYVMEELCGQTLADKVASGFSLNPQDIAALGLHILNGLIIAHRQNIAHNDLCPANIFLVEKPGEAMVPKLINFASELTPEQARPPYSVGGAFRVPEAPDTKPGPAYDIYSLGAVLKSLLPDPVPDSEAASKLVSTLARACSPSPPERFSDMAEFGAELLICFERFKGVKKKGPPPRVRPARKSRAVLRAVSARKPPPLPPGAARKKK